MFTTHFFDETDQCHLLREVAYISTKLRVCTAQNLDDFAFILGELPFAGFGYMILEGGLTEQVINSLPLWRLQSIRQLGKLFHFAPWQFENSTPMYEPFSHTRFVHSADVRALALLIAANNQLDEHSSGLLEFAALTHDICTPVCSDAVKTLDQQGFDEDLNYANILQTEKAQALLADLKISKPEAVDAVQNERTVEGKIRDISDKLAYLARDLKALLERPWPKLRSAFDKIIELADKRRYMLGIWETVRVRDNDVYIEDPDWLNDLLMLRALMFKNLYMSPETKFLEHFSIVVFVRCMLKEGLLTMSDLLQFSDYELEHMIRENFGGQADPTFVGTHFEMPKRIEIFNSVETALTRQRELLNSGVPLVSLDVQPAPKSGTNLLVRTGNKLDEFRKFFPKRAAEIDAVMRSIPTIKLYYTTATYKELPRYYQRVADSIRTAG